MRARDARSAGGLSVDLLIPHAACPRDMIFALPIGAHRTLCSNAALVRVPEIARPLHEVAYCRRCLIPIAAPAPCSSTFSRPDKAILTDGGDSRHNLTKLELVENRCKGEGEVSAPFALVIAAGEALSRYSLVFPAASNPTIRIPVGVGYTLVAVQDANVMEPSAELEELQERGDAAPARPSNPSRPHAARPPKQYQQHRHTRWRIAARKALECCVR